MIGYSGLCIGGPRDGDHYTSMTAVLRFAVNHSGYYVADEDDPLLLAKFEYTHRNLVPLDNKTFIEAWVPRGMNDDEAIRIVFKNYQKVR